MHALCEYALPSLTLCSQLDVLLSLHALCEYRVTSMLCANTRCLCACLRPHRRRANRPNRCHHAESASEASTWRSLPQSLQQERGATTSSQHELQLSCHAVPEGLVVEASTGVKLVHRLQNVPGVDVPHDSTMRYG